MERLGAPLEQVLNEHQLRCVALAEQGACAPCLTEVPAHIDEGSAEGLLRSQSRGAGMLRILGAKRVLRARGVGAGVLRAGPSRPAHGPLWQHPARRGWASADGAPARPRRAGAGLQLQARARHVFREAARVPEFRAICHAPDAAPDAKLARLGALMDASQASCR